MGSSSRGVCLVTPALGWLGGRGTWRLASWLALLRDAKVRHRMGVLLTIQREQLVVREARKRWTLACSSDIAAGSRNPRP